MSVDSIAARTAAAVRSGRVAAMPAAWASAVADAASRSSSCAASSCRRRSSIIASASGASSTSMTPGRMSRPRRRLCSRQVSTSGAGSVATARPRTLAGSRSSGRTLHPVASAISSEEGGGALPQRLPRRWGRQVEREVAARPRWPRRPAAEGRRGRGNGCSPGRGRGWRRSCAAAGSPAAISAGRLPRRAPSWARRASCASRRGASANGCGTGRGSMGKV